ncbi:MAG: hypothetical protein M1821_008218 [Bathelium mastoideum]|nr:MAG: hypothetical protein M1821_008218 [Bathelium mastoideum]
MTETLIGYFYATLPEELGDYCRSYLGHPDFHSNENFDSLFSAPLSQQLFALRDLEVDEDSSLKSDATWTDRIFHRLGQLLSTRHVNDELAHQDDDPAKRQHFFFILGLAALYAFLQSNVTGPPLPSYSISQLGLHNDYQDPPSVRAKLVHSLGEDGIAAYKLTPNVELLCLAEAIFTCPPILKNIKAARWAKLRVDFLHQRLLSEISPSLQNCIYSDLDLLNQQILGSTSQNVQKTTKIEYLLERATIHTHHGLDKRAREDLDAARRESGFEYALTGLLGKRTKFQERDLSQLVVLARSAELKGDAIVNAANNKQTPLTTPNGIDNQAENADVGTGTGPRALDLNDDTLLESISFAKKDAEPGVMEESNLPPSLASLDPSAQPMLDSLDSITLLSLASSITNTSPADGLTREETLPYALRALEGGSSNWQVYTQALLVRSRIEAYKSRTVERGLLQLQALVDQVIAETTKQHDQRQDQDQDQASGATTFLPRAKDSESASAAERLRHIFQLCTPFRWELEAELAAKWATLGGLKTALEIYDRLEMWAEVALCWAATEKEEKARRIIRRQLFHASSGPNSSLPSAEEDMLEREEWTGPVRDPPPADAPRLYCILGDIDHDPALYEKAWEVSRQRYARAQRSLGKFYFAAKDYAKAALSYNKALGANQLNQASWFALGCALLQLSQYDRAADAFTRTVQLDDTDAEAWTNLAAALLHRGTDSPVDSNRPALDEDSIVGEAPLDPQRHRKDALRALKRAAALKHDSPMIWENVITISASLSPPSYSDIVRGMQRVIAIRSPSLGEKAIDADILDLLINHLIRSSDAYNPSRPGLERLVVELVDQKIIPLITSSRRLWQIVARLALWRNKPGSALEAQEKAWRAVTAQPRWEFGTEEQWNEVIDATIELCEAYESLGPRERTEGLSAGQEVVAKDWKFKARSAVRGVMGKGKGSWEGSQGWAKLEHKMVELRGH